MNLASCTHLAMCRTAHAPARDWPDHTIDIPWPDHHFTHAATLAISYKTVYKCCIAWWPPASRPHPLSSSLPNFQSKLELNLRVPNFQEAVRPNLNMMYHSTPFRVEIVERY